VGEQKCAGYSDFCVGEQKCGGYYASGIASGITVGTITSIFFFLEKARGVAAKRQYFVVLCSM